MIRLKVKEVAQARGISQGKLSRKADIDVKTLRRIFRNPLEVITTETLDKLAVALEVDVCDLIEYSSGAVASQRLPATAEETEEDDSEETE